MSDNSTHLPLTETLTPATQAEAAEMVLDAAKNGTPIYPIGGGTFLESQGGRSRLSESAQQNGTISPDNHLRPLSTSKLNRVIDYPADDMTVTVEAGMTIGELKKLLGKKRQWLPVDVAFPDRATVGGAVAVNAYGPRRYAYGTMRDYVLGFTAVDGTGMAFSGGGRVVKNAAGYNMCRLMAGSRGTLGILTQVTLMVRPLPEAAALLACDLPSFDLAEKLLADLVRSQVRPVAIELLANRSREGNPLFGPMLEGNVARLYVGFEGLAVEVEWMLNRLREEWASAGMTSPMLMPNLTTDKLWTWMAEFPTEMRFNLLPSKTVEFLAQFEGIGLIQCHAGDGEILLGGAGFELGETEYVMLDGENQVKVEEYEIEDETLLRGIRILRAIKERFDPKNILNPGIEKFYRR